MWINSLDCLSPPYYVKACVRTKRTLGPYPPTDLIIKPESRDRSYIRVANFSPETPEIDVYIGNRLLAKDLQFGELTIYITVIPGKYKLTLTPPGDRDNPYFSSEITIEERSVISTIAVNLLDPDARLKVIDDDVYVLPNKIFIKFVNTVYDSPPLDFILNLNKLFSNVTYPMVTDFKLIDMAYLYNLIIQRADTNEVIFNIPNIVLEPGKVYTFYGIGLMEGDPPFEVVASLDGSSYFLN
ncbi:uncharacterized protein DUF4397 [Natranaerovirga pectinivora]|uniref:Uncharacterized protein DUF4397 n=1 Tax=Natranaerovirga pectinivora TaxID=682400 RepID=A0A4R3MI61_9FIRM|nr:DUF4397 domain-containing protein [Natranaerovirga pectinivora]TCT12127.1 uncharacterized protein DUF4397 [Natranaerovirga pectinivora]